MKKIITALQNENVNKKLSEYNNIKIMSNDIQYQEGIIETLEIDKEIDYIIFSELLPGEMKIDELINKIKKINANIKIIIILESKKIELENYLLSKGNIFIFYNNEITIEDLIKIIEEKTNQEILEQELFEIKKLINKDELNSYKEEQIEKNKEYFLSTKESEEIEKEVEEEFKQTKIINKIYSIFQKKETKSEAQIILIMGLRGCGKTFFTINLAKQFKNKKILIIEINSKNKDIAFLIPKNKSANENLSQTNSINNKIDLIFQNEEINNEIAFLKEIKKWKEIYDVILIDTEEEMKEGFSILLEEIDKIIFLAEANILQIKKSKEYLEERIKRYKINKDKINFIFNKANSQILSFNILKNSLKEYNILGKIDDVKNSNFLINHNFNNIFLDNTTKRQYKNIGTEILKSIKHQKYYLNKINNN
jgi:soluble cytochrome b562